ncbi:MAG TPA: NAD-dependent epimerase/dehydratase family protein [Acidimicrobiales bacterium]|nr:NAD-dependent epimerase/dehydratase family protein [Acidimicrobiales bacterium]
MWLVTGGAGFIGSHVVQAALHAGHRVRVLDDLSTGDPRRLSREVELVRGDAADADVARRAAAGAEVVVHLAAHRAVPRSVDDPLATDRANTHGTLAVLEAARAGGARRVVLASSSSVYGSAAALPTPETAEPRPASPYAVSKLAGEHYARVHAELFGLSTVSLRLFNAYGPGQSPEGPYAQLVPRVLDALRRGDRPVVFGDGTQSRDLVYVGDVARAVLAAAATDAVGVVNIGSGRATSVLDVIAAATRAMGVRGEPHFLPARPGDVPHTCADPRRAAALLGWRATVPLEEGLRRTARAPVVAAA